MAVIACQDCGKKISSRAVICSYCGFQLGEATDADIEVYKARRLRDRIYRLNMFSYLVITVFIAAFAWYWWASKGFSEPSPMGPFILMGLAAVAYLIVRALLFRSRQQKKEMRRRMKLSADLRRNL